MSTRVPHGSSGRPPRGRPGEADLAPEFVSAYTSQVKERIYAGLTMIAVLVGLSQAHSTSRTGAATAVAATALGLWLATLVADEQAHRAVHGRAATVGELRRMLFVSSPLLASAVTPLLLIGASGLGVMHLHTALVVAAGSELAGLFGWGYLGGRRMGGRMTSALLAGALNTAIGAGVIVVKLLAGH